MSAKTVCGVRSTTCEHELGLDLHCNPEVHAPSTSVFRSQRERARARDESWRSRWKPRRGHRLTRTGASCTCATRWRWSRCNQSIIVNETLLGLFHNCCSLLRTLQRRGLCTTPTTFPPNSRFTNCVARRLPARSPRPETFEQPHSFRTAHTSR